MTQTSFLPAHDRVRDRSAPGANRKIEEATRTAIERSLAGGRQAITRRLAELDHEWDIDRALMVNLAVLGAASYAAGLRSSGKARLLGRRGKGFPFLLGAQIGFLLLHGLLGWCPPAALLRRLGCRTKGEIEAERHVLMRALEGTA